MGSRAIVDIKECIGCGSCQSVCPVESIVVDQETGYAWSDPKCIACGACTVVCPAQCISIDSIKQWYAQAKAQKIATKNFDPSIEQTDLANNQE